MLKKTLFIMFMFLVLNLFEQGDGRVLSENGLRFVKTRDTDFFLEGKPIYFNGFNAYWLMMVGSNPGERGNVTAIFQQANKHGLTLGRTWAFSDGGQIPLQISPGNYNEDTFKGLDFAVSEASKYGIYLILSLVNNYPDFGGRDQYIEWGRQQGGQQLQSIDDFYTNPVVKGYYKNHIKTILERRNSFTGVVYKNDPTIFAWELINEPRCESDISGKILQSWIQEMASYIKSIDSNHLVQIGLEGFYGESKQGANPHGYLLGTDFISNNQISEIDFATIHAYPDVWFNGSDDQTQLNFVKQWLQVHTEDSNKLLKKPLLFTEFGKSSKVPSYSTSRRDEYFNTVYNDIYASLVNGGACSGSLFWQALNTGMNNLGDGYEIVLAEQPSTANIIARQSHKLSKLHKRKSKIID